MPSLIHKILIISLLATLNGCGFFEKDNTPTPSALLAFTPQIKVQAVWTAQTGSHDQAEYLKLQPAIDGEHIYTASSAGRVTAINKESGKIIWQVPTSLVLLAGPGAGQGLVIVAGSKGDIIALDQVQGTQRWKVKINGEVLAPPTIAKGKVYIKTTEGCVRALSLHDGSQQWVFQQAEPNLILRGSSSAIAYQNSLVSGFANGNIAKLDLENGQLEWLQSIASPQGAFAIERMIDVDANPIIYDGHLYAATYQGAVASIDWANSRIRWSQQLSSYTGMIADPQALYISDAKGAVFAFERNSGALKWQQKQLAFRVLSAPTSLGSYIIVGDAQGFLHWLNKSDGSLAARIQAGSAIYAAPISDQNKLYVVTHNGTLIAYTITTQNH